MSRQREPVDPFDIALSGVTEAEGWALRRALVAAVAKQADELSGVSELDAGRFVGNEGARARFCVVSRLLEQLDARLLDAAHGEVARHLDPT